MAKQTVNENWLDMVDDAFDEFGCELERLESVLVAYECAAEFGMDNPNYDKPDFVVLFRTLRKMRRELAENFSQLHERFCEGKPRRSEITYPTRRTP